MTGKKKTKTFTDGTHGGYDGAKAKAIACIESHKPQAAAAAANAELSDYAPTESDEGEDEAGAEDDEEEGPPPAKRRETAAPRT